MVEGTSWLNTAREVVAFDLDVVIDVPAHIPGWLLRELTPEPPRLPPIPIANHHGHVRSADAMGREAELVSHYRSLLLAAPGWQQRRDTRSGCFDVGLLIKIPGEPDLCIDMFNGAAQATAELLAVMAGSDAPEGPVYDDLDQGWALRIVATPDAVFTLEWDWERPEGDDTPRALRFPRRQFALQAAAALQRLQRLHAVLVKELGHDLWNQPPRRISSPSVSRHRNTLVLLLAIALLALLRGCVRLAGFEYR
jgi:hypothetical protein